MMGSTVFLLTYKFNEIFPNLKLAPQIQPNVVIHIILIVSVFCCTVELLWNEKSISTKKALSVHRCNYVFIICRPITMREWKFRSHQDHKLNIFFVSLKDPTFNNRKQPLYNIRLFLAWFCADVYNIG